MQRPGERGWFGSGGDTGAAVGHVCETGDLPTTVVDDDASAETAGTTAEPTAETRHTTNPRPSVSAAQASYLDAVSSAIASMPPETLSKSIEYVLAPVLRVMRLETDALGVLISGTTDGSSVAQEPPARRAERLNALESSVRCVCTCVRTAGSCGTTPETAVEVFFMLIVCLGHVATADGLAGSENWNAAKEKNGDGPHFENSQAAFETLKVVVLDAMMACLATYTTGNASVLISLINQTNLPKVGYLISLLLATAKGELGKGGGASRTVRRDALLTLRQLVKTIHEAEEKEWTMMTDKEQQKNVSEQQHPNRKRNLHPGALAFFLPGIVGGCASAISGAVGGEGHDVRMSRQSRSGGGGVAEDAKSLEACVGILADICVATLSDTLVLGTTSTDSRLPKDNSTGSTENTRADTSASDLTRLSAQLARVASGTNANRTKPKKTLESSSSNRVTLSEPTGPEVQLRVVRTADWRQAASPKVASAISQCYRHIVTRETKPATRVATATASLRVLETCGAALGANARAHLLATALSVAGDPMVVLSIPGSRGTRVTGSIQRSEEHSRFGSIPGGTEPGRNPVTVYLAKLKLEHKLNPETLQSCFRVAVGELPGLVKQESQSLGKGGEAGVGTACARRLGACVELIGESNFTELVATTQSARRSLANAFATCFEFSQSGGNTDAVASSSGGNDWNNNRSAPKRWIAGDCGTTTGSACVTTVVPPPTPPSGNLQYLNHDGLYKSVALCLRGIGAYRTSTTALIECHLNHVREIFAGAEQCADDFDDDEGEDSDEGNAHAGVAAFKRKAMAHVLVVTELLFGASEARLASERRKKQNESELNLDATDGETPERPRRRTTHAHTTSEQSSSVVASVNSVLHEILTSSAWNAPTSLRGVLREIPKKRFATRKRHENKKGPPQSESGKSTARFVITAKENARLVVSLIECVGACALARGETFVRDGGFLPAALTPLLQKLGDDDETVKETAANVLGAVCQIGRFETASTPDTRHDARVETADETAETLNPKTLNTTDASTATSPPLHKLRSRLIGTLVANNADYVVDALSRRLRRLEDFPDAPQFFKAVLGDAQSDAARVLLPFLKDPILRVAEHLGIGNRDTSNVNSNGGSFGDKTGTADGSTADDVVTVFLQILSVTSSAVVAEATCTLREIEIAQFELKPLLDALSKMNDEEVGKGRGGLIGVDEGGLDVKGELSKDDTANPDDMSGDDTTHHTKEPQQDRLTASEIAVLTQQLPPHLHQWRRRRSRVARLSRLTAVMLTASAPLMESGFVTRRMCACAAVTKALQGLSALAVSDAKDKNVTDALRKAFPDEVPEDDAVSNPDDKIVKVLPMVHTVWPHVVVSVVGYPKGPSIRPDAFQKSCETILALASASQPGHGAFVARRFFETVWPCLQRALKFGVPDVDLSNDSLETRLQRVVLIDDSMKASFAGAGAGLIGNGSANGLMKSVGASDGGTDTQKLSEKNGEATDTKASEKVKLAVLDLLLRLANEADTKEALRDVAPHAIGFIAPLACGEKSSGSLSGSRKVSDKAIATLVSLSTIAKDAAWLELNKFATNRHDAGSIPVAPRVFEGSEGTDGSTISSRYPALPSFRTICPVSAVETTETVALAAGVILEKIEVF